MWHPLLRPLVIVGFYTVAWSLLDRASVGFETAPEVGLFYPSPALDFVLLLGFGLRYLPALLLPRLLDVWVVPPIDLPPIVGLGYALLATIVYGGAGVALVRGLRVEPELRRLRDVFRFLVVATLLAPLLLALLAVTGFAIAGVVPRHNWGICVLHLWVGHSVGIASLTPFLLVWVLPWLRSRPRIPSWLKSPSQWLWLEWSVEAIALVGGTWVSFGQSIEGKFRFLYLCFLPMIWLTVRYGLGVATLAVLVINSGAALATANRLTEPGIGLDMVTSQFCMLAVCQTALLLGATITRRFESYTQIQTQAQREQLLNQIGRSLNSTRNPELVLQEIVRLAGESFQVDRGVLWRLGEAQISVIEEWRKQAEVPSILNAQSSPDDWFGPRDPDEDSRQRQPFQAYNYAALPHTPSRAALIRQAQIKSILRVPIFVRCQFFGSLCLHTTADYRTFSLEEVRWLEQIAEQAAIALHNAHSFECLETLVQERTQALEQEKWLSETANSAKSQFLATMSHELRTPLTSILGFSSVLIEQAFGPLNDRQQQYMGAIHDSGKHLLDLINDVLDLSRIEAGREELTFEPIVVEELCERCQMFVSERAQQRGLDLRLEIALGITTCSGDRRRLLQILVNLLSNAVKFTEAGSVTLRVSQSQDTIEFAVIDTGIGIAEDDRAKLFQPFQQLDSQVSRHALGTGLGLALSRQLARLHGGEIILSSEVGHGSCFTLRLPQPAPSSP